MDRALGGGPMETTLDTTENIAITIAMEFINTVRLKNDTNRVIRQVARTKKTVVVTQHGVPAVAIVPIGENDLALTHELKFLKAIRQGLKDIAAGRTTSMRSFARRHLRKRA